MPKKEKLLFVLAHPDDESLGAGGIIAKYVQQGVEVHLITATRGEYGWQTPEKPFPGPEELGKIREAELKAAADILGIHTIHHLDYIDGYLDQANHHEVIAKIVTVMREVRPQVVITFGPDGGYGHPDHIAISQFTTAAILCCLDQSYSTDSALAPHRIDKLYFLAWPPTKLAAFEAAFGAIEFPVDDHIRISVPWPEWAITTVIDTHDYVDITWDAIACHQSQLPLYDQLKQLPDEHKQNMFGTQELYRAMSMVNSGRTREEDIFDSVE